MKNLKMIVIPAVTVALTMGSFAYFKYGTVESRVVKVTNTERLTDGDSSKWIVMTDYTSFENTDSLLHWKFNSTDLQGKLESSTMYELTYYGYRIPFLSAYPNIIRVKEVAQ